MRDHPGAKLPGSKPPSSWKLNLLVLSGECGDEFPGVPTKETTSRMIFLGVIP